MYTNLFFIRKKDYSRKKKKDLIKSSKIIINSLNIYGVTNLNEKQSLFWWNLRTIIIFFYR